MSQGDDSLRVQARPGRSGAGELEVNYLPDPCVAFDLIQGFR